MPILTGARSLRLSTTGRAPSRSRRLALALGSVLVLLLAGTGQAGAAEIVQLTAARSRDGLDVSLRLEGAFSPEIENRILSGLEVAFEYTVRLRRRRGGFDKSVSERSLVASVQYSNLTKMYKVMRRVDGTVTDADVTDRAEQMRAWMTEFSRLALFDGRDLDASGRYYVRARAKLLSRFRMLFVPWDLETDWAETETIRFEKGRP